MVTHALSGLCEGLSFAVKEVRGDRFVAVGAPGGVAFYAYSTSYLVDVCAGIIVDVEARGVMDKVRGVWLDKPGRILARLRG